MKFVDKKRIKEIISFELGKVYTLLMIARKKDNDGITNSQEKVFREIVTHEGHFDRKYDALVKIAKSDPDNHYKFYITFNGRSVEKAYKTMKERFAQWDFELSRSPEQIMDRIGKIHNEWTSQLQKNCFKKEWMMLDLDDKDRFGDVEGILVRNGITYYEDFDTQNGYHVLFHPCDTRAIMEEIKNAGIDCELKRDDLLQIGRSKSLEHQK